MPEELFSQMPIVKELISLLGYRIIEIDTWEADDILGTLATGATEKDFCYIATYGETAETAGSVNTNQSTYEFYIAKGNTNNGRSLLVSSKKVEIFKAAASIFAYL